MGVRDKIKAISLNVKINKRKSVHIRGYKLPINLQNFMQKDSAEAKISSKIVGGYFFDSPCRRDCEFGRFSDTGYAIYGGSYKAN